MYSLIEGSGYITASSDYIVGTSGFITASFSYRIVIGEDNLALSEKEVSTP